MRRPQSASKSHSLDVLIRGGQLIQAVGIGARADAVLLVRNGIIDAIGKDAERGASADASVIDLGTSIIAPGLIDSHVHLIWSGRKNALFDAIEKTPGELTNQATRNMHSALSCGVTTVRDCGGIGDVVIPLVRAVENGSVRGPRIVTCGAPITTRKGHCWFLQCEAEGREGVRSVAREMIDAGADFIKVMVTGGGSTPGTDTRASQYSIEELRELVSTAHGSGLTIAGHVHGTEGIELAVKAGFDELEHCTWLARHEDGIDYRPDCVKRIVAGGVYVCKTLAGFQRWRIEEIDRQHPVWEELSTMRSMMEEGVRFIAGTDAGIDLTDFAGLNTTLETMVAAGGMSSADAFASATEVAAQALGMGDAIGTLEVGKFADCVALDHNPLEDIRALRKVRAVIRSGEVVARDGS